MAKPHLNLKVVHHILKYVNKIDDFGLLYASGQYYNNRGFTDASWAACPKTQRSTERYCFIMTGATITRQSKR
uniref:Uncharacterized protein n=1 Tax=Physcomitrium patens TaxID=3218 RepID=A0A2K1L9D8_PHYPA|nr:hypothetical protein PHYPA_001048 [Physcomitrium patens]